MAGKHQQHEFLGLEVKGAASDAVDSSLPSAADYSDKCSTIIRECRAAADALRGKYDANLAALKAECEKQTRILEGNEEDHSEEKADAKEEKMEVGEARMVVKDYDQCRPELEEAKAELNEQEAIPNDLPQDVDAECKARKLVIRKEACVARLRKAEAVLAKEERDHKDQVKERDEAFNKISPQAERKRKACLAYENEKNKGPPKAPTCQPPKDALLRQADQDIEDMLAEYLKQKRALEIKQDTHADEEADVDVEEREVRQAEEAVRAKAHCPPELEEAEAELARQEAIPNDSAADIDAECEARKAVLKARPCVEEFKKAEAALAREKEDLSEENREENHAERKVSPQERKTAKAKAALDAARAARTALPCDNPDGAGSDKPDKPDKPEPKSGAARAAALAVVAVLCAAVHVS